MRFTGVTIVISIRLFWPIFDLLLVPLGTEVWMLMAGTFDLNLTPDKRTILLHDEQTLIKELSVRRICYPFSDCYRTD
jgi:hypothetical protein